MEKEGAVTREGHGQLEKWAALRRDIPGWALNCQVKALTPDFCAIFQHSQCHPSHVLCSGICQAAAKSLKTTKRNQIRAAMDTFSQGADEV